jgi:glucose-6-phosphate 1-epimerase
LTYEEALHSYFQVADIHRVRIRGLEGTPLLDKVMGGQRLPGSDAAIEFGGETDRVYAPTRADCTILDPGMHRAIEIQKSGSQTTVVWNPWISKSAKMPDFGDDEWPGMVCVETANVGEYAVVIHPHDTHVMRVGISSRPLLPGEL